MRWFLVPLASAYGMSAALFPSDTQTPTESEGLKLLEAVCPGPVHKQKTLGCGEFCPTSSGLYVGPWVLKRVTYGHFLSPSSDDAVLAMDGCEPHGFNYGGSVLLTRRAGRWSTLWYKGGVETSKCHKVALPSGREILVCIGESGEQGQNTTELFIEDLTAPTQVLLASENSFFVAFDNTLNCGWGGFLIHSTIAKVDFQASDGTKLPMVSVTASFGRRKMTKANTVACFKNTAAFLPKMRTYRIDFVYRKRAYRPVPSSAPIVRMFADRSLLQVDANPHRANELVSRSVIPR